MKTKTLSFLIALVISSGLALPANADGILGGVGSMFGAVTATLFDVPEGIVVESLWRQPYKTQRLLAEHFGDSDGFQQNVAAFVLGVPYGFVYGMPYGAVHGARYGWKTGWEQPFSTESYLVAEE